MTAETKIPSAKLLEMLAAVQKIDANVVLLQVMYASGISGIVAENKSVVSCDTPETAGLEAPRSKIRIPS